MRIPVDEGERFRIGELRFEGNEILLEEGLQRIFDDIETGDYYSEQHVREGSMTLASCTGRSAITR